MEGVSWPEVFERLEGRQVAPDLHKYLDPIRPKRNIVVNDFPDSSCLETIKSIKYLHDRGLGESVWRYYGLLYGTDGVFSGISIKNSLVCPIFDIDGAYRTFQVRYLSDRSAKRWMNPSGSPNQDLLYGGWLINNYTDHLWIVEGASDTWNLFSCGEQAVGLFTKEASSGQLNRIHNLCTKYSLTPVVCLDGDVEEKSIKCLTNEISAYNMSPKVIRLLSHEDPGSLSADRIAEVKRMLF